MHFRRVLAGKQQFSAEPLRCNRSRGYRSPRAAAPSRPGPRSPHPVGVSVRTPADRQDHLAPAMLPGCVVVQPAARRSVLRLSRDPGRLRAALAAGDPQRGPLIIDEIQKLPSLLDDVHGLMENGWPPTRRYRPVPSASTSRASKTHCSPRCSGRSDPAAPAGSRCPTPCCTSSTSASPTSRVSLGLNSASQRRTHHSSHADKVSFVVSRSDQVRQGLRSSTHIHADRHSGSRRAKSPRAQRMPRSRRSPSIPETCSGAGQNLPPISDG